MRSDMDPVAVGLRVTSSRPPISLIGDLLQAVRRDRAATTASSSSSSVGRFCQMKTQSV